MLAALLRDELLWADAERGAVIELVRWPLTGHAPGWLPLARPRDRRSAVQACPRLPALQRRRLAAALSEAGAA